MLSVGAAQDAARVVFVSIVVKAHAARDNDMMND